MFRITGKTVDTNNTVFEVKREGSWLEGCIHDKGVNIWAVNSVRKGDLKRMLNTVVQKTRKDNITFTMVINDNLKQVLHGFKEGQVWFEPCKEYITVLEGVWRI